MTETKYCKDCKFCKPTRLEQILTLGWQNPYKFATCSRPNFPGNLVDGGPIYNNYCENERRDYNHRVTCGLSGKYWEARK